jgi:hypothetical protein
LRRPKSLKIGSLAELATRARAEPGRFNWAPTPGGGYFVFAGFQKTADLPMVQVPYRDITQALGDLAEGRIHIMIASLAIVMPQVQAGKVRLLAVTNQRRAPIAPEVPTVGEAGYPDLLLDGFTGFFGPRNMPRERRDRITADIQAVANDPVLRDRLATAGQAARGSTADELAATIAQQRAHIERTAKLLGPQSKLTNVTRPSEPDRQYDRGPRRDEAPRGQTADELTLTPAQVLLRQATGFQLSQAIWVAAKLSVADHLQDGPRTVAQLASITGCQASALYRLLRALAAFEVFQEVERGTFALTPRGACLCAGGDDSIRDLVLLFAGENFWQTWGALLHSVRTGETAFPHLFGVRNSFEYYARNPQESER